MNEIEMRNLYHYTKTDTAIRYILPKMALRMNFLKYMNDPKENLLHQVDYTETFHPLRKCPDDSYRYLLALNIRENTRIVSFSTDKNVKIENTSQVMNGYEYQKMWSFYGQNHEGICLEIDFNLFNSENKKAIKEFEIIDKKVVYNFSQFSFLPTVKLGVSRDKYTDHRTLTSTEHWEKFIKDEKEVCERFFTKNIDWEGESEYRFLTFSDYSEDIYLSIKESLSKVILGLNFSKYLLPSVVAIVPKEKIYQIQFDQFNGRFRIENVF
ncbi:MAG: DUF2971 domain-containing protein [Tenuifilaceae bacterium]|jgi:hypothetical protein|nr:DUF2971 domain-containing protein [Tenuifilaceae bacterium]